MSLTASYPFHRPTRPLCGSFFCCLPHEHTARIARFSYPWTSLTHRCGRVRIIGAMATDSMFSHNNAPLQDCESILADVRKIFSLY